MGDACGESECITESLARGEKEYQVSQRVPHIMTRFVQSAGLFGSGEGGQMHLMKHSHCDGFFNVSLGHGDLMLVKNYSGVGHSTTHLFTMGDAAGEGLRNFM